MEITGFRSLSRTTGAGAKRWWTYQRERFPVRSIGPMVAAFSVSTISFSMLLRGGSGIPDPRTLLVGFLTTFLFFLQLRIADEFKDFADDARYRPYRAVPRGLVSLRELGLLGVIAAIVQGVLAVWLSPALLPLLVTVWGYFALMRKEFFARDWLKAHPVTYMWSHMLIMPLIDLYVSACDWLVSGAGMHPQLVWLLLVSFCNGFVWEIGRKIRAPQDEELGVETYSALWGPARAAAIWWVILMVTAAIALAAASQIRFAPGAGVLLVIPLLAATVIARRFRRTPAQSRGKLIEGVSAIWTLVLYLSLGIAPLLATL